MTIVDYSSCFKVSEFLKMKSSVETAAALESYIATYITRNRSVSAPFVLTTEVSLRGIFSEKLID